MRHSRKIRGSAVTLTIVLSVVLTGLIAAMAFIAGEQSQRTGSLSKIDQASFAAEAGLARVEWYCKNNNLGTLATPVSGTINGYNYKVSWSQLSGGAYLVTSTGSVGTVSYTVSEQMTPPSSAPALASGGNFDNHNIDVTGDAIVGGNYTNAGNGSLSGRLIYYGTATNTTSVAGGVYHPASNFSSSNQAIAMNSLVANLAAATPSTQTYTGPLANPVFNFNSIPGTNKLIYVNGNVDHPTFVGSGTLVVSGTVAAGGYGAGSGTVPTSPVNIVASGDVTTDNNITIYGTLYTGGVWYRGKFSMYGGMVYTSGGVSTSNYAQSTILQGTTPWFDPRASSWCSTTALANFTGPQP